MTNFSRRLIAMAVFLAMQASLVPAQDETKPDAAQPTKPSRAELRDKQLDVSLEARDIERVLTKLKRASELAKTRIADAAKTTESASTALDKGDSKGARGDARQASEMFQEIIKQLEALLTEETPQRVAAARNLAERLAKMERQFAQQFPGVLNPTGSGMNKVDPKSQVLPPKGSQGSGAGSAKKKMDPQEGKGGAGKKKTEDSENPDAPMKDGGGDAKDKTENKDGADGGTKKTEDGDKSDAPMKDDGGDGKDMTEEERREALARRAEQLEKMGETLKDVLQAISQSNDPADKDAVAKLEAILKETDLLKAIEAMKDSAEMIRSDNYDDARLASIDLADRLEITAQRLDAAYRTIVAPQAEELRKLEQALADLREKLETLETQAQVAAWHREAQDLLDRAEKLGISDKVRDDLLEEMKKAGLGINGVRSRFDWGFVNNRYEAPGGYVRPLLNLQEEVQARIQNLLLGDISTAADEATPPKYQDLVERYYQVLSEGAGGKKPEAKKK